MTIIFISYSEAIIFSPIHFSGVEICTDGAYFLKGNRTVVFVLFPDFLSGILKIN